MSISNFETQRNNLWRTAGVTAKKIKLKQMKFI